MKNNNLLIFFRFFKLNKSTVFINLIGLTSALVCALMICLWVYDELNYDKFHEKDSQLFQVMQNIKNVDFVNTMEMTPGLLAKALIEEMPDVEYAVSTYNNSIFGESTLSFGDYSIKKTCLYASKDFFNIFSFDFIQGDENQVEFGKNSIVVSEETALELFKTTDNILGKSIEFENEEEYIVSGIFKEPLFNSSMQFDFVLSYEIINERMPNFSSWENSNPHTYITVKEGTSIEQFNDKIAGLIERKTGDSLRTLFVRPYSDRHLYNNYENGEQTGGFIVYVKLFSIIAIFILLIACINFMNLSTAKASKRIVEIGIKKVLGADRKSIIFQHLSESVLIAFLSLLLAIVIVILLLPQFNEITGKHISMSFDISLILIIIGFTLFTGIIAGSYPALYLSGFNPATVLKGKIKGSMSEMWIRKGLVVFQFVLSSILIVSVLVIYKQIEYIQTKELGFNKDNVIYFDNPYFDFEGKFIEKQETFLAELRKIPGVKKASSNAFNIIGSYNVTEGVAWEGKNENDKIDFEIYFVNYDFIETQGIEMHLGRPFSKKFGAENSKIICNEAAIKIMGIKDPIGKIVNLWGENMQIIGVTKNFHFESFHKQVKPLLFKLEPGINLKITVEIQAEKENEIINGIKMLVQKFSPGFVFDFKFLDEDYQAQYIAEKRIGILSKYFAGLAILISCLGLFGLSAFTIEKRFKEIGIRRALGSSDFRIIYLLTYEITKLVIVSLIIALPISYIISENWLSSFAYSTNLGPWIFLGTGIFTFSMTWFTVGIQTLRALKINLSECLRIND